MKALVLCLLLVGCAEEPVAPQVVHLVPKTPLQELCPDEECPPATDAQVRAYLRRIK